MTRSHDDIHELRRMRATIDTLIDTWDVIPDPGTQSEQLRQVAADARALSDRLVLGRVRTSTFDIGVGHRSGWTKWTAIKLGDRLVVRGKRSPEERIVTVSQLLEPHPADGRGFVGDDGRTYRRFFFDIAYVVDDL